MIVMRRKRAGGQMSDEIYSKRMPKMARRKKDIQDKLMKCIYDNEKEKVYEYTLLYISCIGITECKQLIKKIMKRSEKTNE